MQEMAGGSRSTSKRSRAAGTSSSAPPPPPPPPVPQGIQQWRSPQHEQRFLAHTIYRPFCKERAMVLTGRKYPVFENVMDSRGWRHFCTLPTVSSEEILREFYANAYELDRGVNKVYRSFVRGREIRYDGSSIQRLLHTSFHQTTQVVDCRYKLKLTSIQYSDDPTESAADVLEAIARPGTQWEPKEDGTPRRTVVSNLKGVAKIWYHFIVTSIMPSLNHTEVGIPRAVLLWAIMKGKDVALCNILADSLYDMAHAASKTSSMGHSSLIQYICQAAGVEIPPVEHRRVTVYREIDARWITKTLGAEAAEVRRMEAPEGQPDSPPEQRPQRQPRDRAGPSSTPADQQLRWETAMQFMRQRSLYEYERTHAFQDYMSAQMSFLSVGREGAPPPFQPAPYDSRAEDAFFAAFAGIPSGAAAAPQEEEGSDDSDDTPQIVRDAELDEMSD